MIFGRIFTVIVFCENFEMEVEQANFVTHFIISVQLYYFILSDMNKAFDKNRLYICYVTRLELLNLLFKKRQKRTYFNIQV